jgi:hypothetical protein
MESSCGIGRLGIHLTPDRARRNDRAGKAALSSVQHRRPIQSGKVAINHASQKLNFGVKQEVPRGRNIHLLERERWREPLSSIAGEGGMKLWIAGGNNTNNELPIPRVTVCVFLARNY